MSETKSSLEVNNDFTKAQRSLDYDALGDAFEAQGNAVEAKRFRDLANRQPEVEKRARDDLSAHLAKMQQQQRQNEPPDQQPEIQHPVFNVRSNEGLREQV